VEQLREQLGLKGAAGSSLSAAAGTAALSAASSGAGSNDQSLMSSGLSGSAQPAATMQAMAEQNGLTRQPEAATADATGNASATPGNAAPTGAESDRSTGDETRKETLDQRDAVNQQQASSPFGDGAAMGAVAGLASTRSDNAARRSISPRISLRLRQTPQQTGRQSR